MSNSKNFSEEMDQFAIGSGFNFSGQIIDDLGASEYTLVTIALDESGSISGFETDIEDMLKTAIQACYDSPQSINLMVRVIRFGSQYRSQNGNGVDEIHGFKNLSEIDLTAYPSISGGGATPLNDAVYSGVGAMNKYAEELSDMDYLTNGITFVITDGGENASTATTAMVKDEIMKSVKGEIMESHISVLIGIDAGYGDIKALLKQYQSDTGIDQLSWAGASKSELAKLAQFVSQSISSTSQALGTGGPSQNISATI